MGIYGPRGLVLLLGLAWLTGCAWQESVTQRLDRLETIVKYNHERITTLERVRVGEGARQSETEAPAEGIAFRFRHIHEKDPGIASAVPNLTLFFASGVSSLTPSQEEELGKFLRKAASAPEPLSLTVNGFSSRGADPARDRQLSASRGLSVYNYILNNPGISRVREVRVNACGVQFASGNRDHDRRVDIVLNSGSPQEAAR